MANSKSSPILVTILIAAFLLVLGIWFSNSIKEIIVLKECQDWKNLIQVHIGGIQNLHPSLSTSDEDLKVAHSIYQLEILLVYPCDSILTLKEQIVGQIESNKIKYEME